MGGRSGKLGAPARERGASPRFTSSACGSGLGSKPQLEGVLRDTKARRRERDVPSVPGEDFLGLLPRQVLRLRKLLERAAADSLRTVALWNAAFLPSYDLREAMTAFMAKRAPKLDGR